MKIRGKTRIEPVSLQGGLPSNFIVTLECSSTEFSVALTFRIGTQIEKKLFFLGFFLIFLFLNGFFLGCIEHTFNK